MADLKKTLKTQTKVKCWNYDTGNEVGQAIGVENSNGDYENVVEIESVKCAEGLVNRIIIKRSKLEELGFVIIEE